MDGHGWGQMSSQMFHLRTVMRSVSVRTFPGHELMKCYPGHTIGCIILAAIRVSATEEN